MIIGLSVWTESLTWFGFCCLGFWLLLSSRVTSGFAVFLVEVKQIVLLLSQRAGATQTALALDGILTVSSPVPDFTSPCQATESRDTANGRMWMKVVWLFGVNLVCKKVLRPPDLPNI